MICSYVSLSYAYIQGWLLEEKVIQKLIVVVGPLEESLIEG